MLQKRNTNWLSRKIEAQRERSGVRGKGLGVGLGAGALVYPLPIGLGDYRDTLSPSLTLLLFYC